MKSQEEIRNNPRVIVRETGEDGGNGWIKLGNSYAESAAVVWSFGAGWDHVSISFPRRCPTWEEMCLAKDVFFREDEVCVQYHPRKAEYVNMHRFCLHIWKPQGVELPIPPIWMV